MPYIITTGQRFRYEDANVGGLQIESRRAVATLDEEALRRECKRHQPKMLFSAERTEQIRKAVQSGGTVGPLPDGTVIEVARADWDTLSSAIGHNIYRPTLGTAAIIDAYNAAQEA